MHELHELIATFQCCAHFTEGVRLCLSWESLARVFVWVRKATYMRSLFICSDRARGFLLIVAWQSGCVHSQRKPITESCSHSPPTLVWAAKKFTTSWKFLTNVLQVTRSMKHDVTALATNQKSRKTQCSTCITKCKHSLARIWLGDNVWPWHDTRERSMSNHWFDHVPTALHVVARTLHALCYTMPRQNNAYSKHFSTFHDINHRKLFSFLLRIHDPDLGRVLFLICKSQILRFWITTSENTPVAGRAPDAHGSPLETFTSILTRATRV